MKSFFSDTPFKNKPDYVFDNTQAQNISFANTSYVSLISNIFNCFVGKHYTFYNALDTDHVDLLEKHLGLIDYCTLFIPVLLDIGIDKLGNIPAIGPFVRTLFAAVIGAARFLLAGIATLTAALFIGVAKSIQYAQADKQQKASLIEKNFPQKERRFDWLKTATLRIYEDPIVSLENILYHAPRAKIS